MHPHELASTLKTQDLFMGGLHANQAELEKLVRWRG